MELTDSERERLRPAYGTNVDRWSMNSEVFELFIELLNRSEGCSDVLGLVPWPYHGLSAKQYIRRELVRIVRQVQSDRSSSYVARTRAAALGLRHRFEMAGH
jgi:hypothetical protein